MHYDYFISSRFRNKDQVLHLTRQLEARGKSVYCFIEAQHSLDLAAGEEDPEKVMAKLESIPNWREHPEVQRIFKNDMDALRNSHTLIMLLPAGKSAHLEAGTAYGLDKHLILIGDQEATETLYLIFNEVYSTIDSFITTVH